MANEVMMPGGVADPGREMPKRGSLLADPERALPELPAIVCTGHEVMNLLDGHCARAEQLRYELRGTWAKTEDPAARARMMLRLKVAKAINSGALRFDPDLPSRRFAIIDEELVEVSRLGYRPATGQLVGMPRSSTEERIQRLMASPESDERSK